jgi:hypothetical protein
MDRRDFLKFAAILPFSEEIIKKLTEDQEAEPIKEFMLIDTQTSFAYTAWPLDEYQDAFLAPSTKEIGGFTVVNTEPIAMKEYYEDDEGGFFATDDCGISWVRFSNEQAAKDFLDLQE